MDEIKHGRKGHSKGEKDRKEVREDREGWRKR